MGRYPKDQEVERGSDVHVAVHKSTQWGWGHGCFESILNGVSGERRAERAPSGNVIAAGLVGT